MKNLYRILRTILVTVLLLGLVLPALLWVVLTLPPVQGKLRDVAETELSKLLGVEVNIGELDYRPFNRLTLHDVSLVGEGSDTIATIGRLGAGISLSQYIMYDNIVITYGEIIGLDGHIRRATPDSPLNIQPIIDALSPKDKTKPPTIFDFKISTVIIRQSSLSYDVDSEPLPLDGRFDPNHVAISNMRADITLPRLANDDFTFDIKQLAFAERSGLRLKSLRGDYHITATDLTADKPVVEINGSRLLLGNIALKYNSFATIGSDLRTSPLDLSILEGTTIIPSDFAPLVPEISDLSVPLNITAHASGTLNALDVDYLQITTPDSHIGLDLKGSVVGALGSVDELQVDIPRLSVSGNGARVIDVVRRFADVRPQVAEIVSRLGDVSLEGSGDYSKALAAFKGQLSTDAGNIDLDATLSSAAGTSKVKGNFDIREFDIGSVLARDDLGMVTARADVEAAFAKRLASASFQGNVSRFDFRGHSFTEIAADVSYDGKTGQGEITINDPEMQASISGDVEIVESLPDLHLSFSATGVNPAVLGINTRWPSYRFSTAGTAQLSGTSVNNASGTLFVDYLRFLDGHGRGLDLDDIILEVENASQPQYVSISSQLIDGRMIGTYTLTEIPKAVEHIVARVFPALLPGHSHEDELFASEGHMCDLEFSFFVHPGKYLDNIVKLPAEIAESVTLNGAINAAEGSLSFGMLAPYIVTDKLLIEDSAVNFEISGCDNRASLFLNTNAVTHKDRISLSVNGTGFDDSFDTDIAWNYQRPRRYDGTVSLTTLFSREAPEDPLTTRLYLNPGKFAVADTVWTIYPGSVTMCNGSYTAKDIKVGREDQFVLINGTASRNPSDVLTVELADINLDYIFETLAIDNVMFGGDATGTITASSMLSGVPHLSTDNLSVRNLAYNRSLMGDATIKSEWINDTKAITIVADIEQPNGRHSYVDGNIKPMVDSLDFTFDADRINVGFMLPFMQAFTSEVDGYASGHARLWGSFKYIDMVGDIFAEDLKLKLDFTNTVYYATDSVHLTNGHIDFKDVVLRDIYGKTALLNGWLTHEFFKKPKFEFKVTNAEDFLVYDVKKRSAEDIWYGRVFGTGGARVYGEPGRVDIEVNITTAPKSTFTFELSDALTAYDYNFITFRDRDRISDTLQVKTVSTRPAAVDRFYNHSSGDNHDAPSVYAMDINVDITPDAEMILVMDPVGGDRIRAYGAGNLRLTYDSGSEDLKMFGDYNLERGSYNFTLQDIIVKDFNILKGSSIMFKGDPYAAQLDINAEYVVRANLTDLDESFAYNTDLNHTNVPVHALMHISGDMRQPDISFDLAFPTVKDDVDRMVKSIVSTEDMMNRQIVYLLAMGRFYTPEYMASTTKGNELVSMASSTLSSQIGNILGQLSDNWSIAPNLRSDRGDFTDVEFDVALSSTLLNNRLLLNGNFGYRDNAYNNNNFIGDFDIEYLLNRKGTIRLKAYNRYNDQNYYMRSALTTQGVGVMFRRDFDDLASFFRPRLKLQAPVAPDTLLYIAPADVAPDTVHHE